MSDIRVDQYIIADPKICHGKPTFKGTRIMVWQILEMLAAGETVEEILSNFPSITSRHIKAALEYAAQIAQGTSFVTLKSHEIFTR